MSADRNAEIIRLQDKENRGEELTYDEWLTLEAFHDKQMGYFKEHDDE
jgi:hypothetical protein